MRLAAVGNAAGPMLVQVLPFAERHTRMIPEPRVTAYMTPVAAIATSVKPESEANAATHEPPPSRDR